MHIFIYSFTYIIYMYAIFLMEATYDFCMEEAYKTMSLCTDIRENTNYKWIFSCASNTGPKVRGLIIHITIVHYFP